MVPSQVPDAPQTSKSEVVSNTEIEVSWTVPLRDGEAPVTAYRVEWDTSSGAREVQRVALTSQDNVMQGTFKLSFKGQTSVPLQWDASASEIQNALSNLNTIGLVQVSPRDSLQNAWSVTFTTNVGDLPLMSINTEGIVGTGVVGTVTTVVHGSAPGFDAGTVGINVMPLGSATVSTPLEVQQIVCSAGSNDLGGDFKVQFMGETSTESIPFDASADTVVRVLEGLKTIGSVVVTRELFNQSTSAPVSRHAYAWNVTFTSPFLNAGDVPSILVSTNDGTSATTIATGGITSSSGTVTAGLTGTSPRVEVFELVKGTVPMRYTISNLSPSSSYFTRVAAINKHGLGPWITSTYSSKPKQTTPSVCRDVTVSAESGTRIGVWWQKPLFEGGDPISKYEVQWSTTESFGNLAQIATVTPEGDEYYNHTITGLTPGQAYYVQVLPYNSIGFGAPVTASVQSNWEEIQVISLESTGAGAITSGQFRLTYQALGSSRTVATPAIDYDATAASMQEAMQSLPGVGAVEVQRVDQSTAYDVTSSTASKYQWYITFLSVLGDVAQLTVDETNSSPEIQSIYVYGAKSSLTAGSYKLKFAEFTTSGCISYNADATTVANAINSMDASIDATVTASAITNREQECAMRVSFSTSP